MFLSVSIPVYNASMYLDECISSIMSQTEDDYELILVDDGSKDNSIEICRKWRELYPDTIRVIEKDNSGSLLTRRKCIEESKGEFLYIMDADDYLMDIDALKKIKSTIERSGCDLVFFNCTTKVNTKEPLFKYPFDKGMAFESDNKASIYRYYIEYNGLNPLWNKVFHRSLIDTDEDYEKKSYVTNGTDRFQSTPIISKAKRIVYLDEVLYFYRTKNNNASIVHTFKQTAFLSAKTNFERLCLFSKSWDIPENELNQLLSTAYMKMISTSAYKVRLMDSSGGKEAIEYLRTIREDRLFREYYSLNVHIGFFRNAITYLLYLRKYRLLYMLIILLRGK